MSAMPVTTLRDRVDSRTAAWVEMVADSGLRGVFNPSVHVGGRDTAFAIRATDCGTITSHLLVADTDGSHRSVDLSAHCAPVVVADPKLFTLDGDRWVTFNTGWSPNRNDIYVMRLDPTPGPALRCHVDGRQSVEKNWGFYEDEGRLRAVYSLSPLVILDAELPADSNDEIEFQPVVGDIGGPKRSPRRRRRPVRRELTIGTQPVLRGRELRLIAHEKFEALHRRIYVGRTCTIDLTPETPTASFGTKRLVHSWRSMFGSRSRPNPHLISCTYFSGLAVVDDTVLLAYGINDVDAGFAAVEWEDVT
jgi:hypothetical protein